MIHLNRIQLRWSILALAATCLLGLLSSEFVAKKLIVSAETSRLQRLLEQPLEAPENGVERFSVLTDGSLLGDENRTPAGLGRKAVLRLVYESLEGESYRGGWVYAAEPAKFGGEAASGWLVLRSNVGERLESAYLAVAGLSFGVWLSFCGLFCILHSRLLHSVKAEVERMRGSLGLERSGSGAEIVEVLSRFSAELRDFHKSRERTLEEMEPLAAIAAHAGEGIFVCDAAGRIEWANDAFVEMVGSSLEELQRSEPFAYMRTERNDPLYLARLGRAMELGDSVSLELAGARPDGSEYWASLDLKPLDVKADGTKRFFGIQIDITEQRRASAELEEVSRRFALAMESANVGIWDWDVKRDDLVWDDHTFGLYGVSRTTFKPSYRSWMGCIDPDDTNRVVRAIDSSLASGENIDLVLCARRRGGSEVYIKCVGRAFHNEAGEVTRYIGIASDVTAEHGAKKNLIEQKEEAETLAIRLAEAVKQSKQAAREAYQATRAKSAFLAMMSHEIRTPMNGVIGMASLLLETELDEYQRDYLNTIRISGDTLLTLINDILDYSKIESGKLEIEMAPFSIRECVEEAADLLASKAAEKGVDLVCRIDRETPGEVVGDITRLRQVLVNLVGNAIKFTDVGEVVIQVHAPAEGKVRFSVRDTGIGIPKDRINRLFEVFSQVDSSTTRKYGGSGLGLSISKQLTGLMGGEMWVESSVGRGSVFHFDIAFENLADAACDAVFGEQAELVGKKVLIAQPNSVLRGYLESLSRGWGMDTVAVSSIESCSQGAAYDIVLADDRDASLESEECREMVAALRKRSKLFVQLLNHGEASGRGHREQRVYKPCKVSSLLETLKSVDRKSRVSALSSDAKDSISESGFALRLPLRILVADDNSVNQKVARMMLKKFGYTADLVANGVEAVEAVKQCDYDLVFMDCQMPEMDGFEATRLIRQIEKDRSSSKRAYIFALTANVRGESMEMSKDAGMDGFLAKPIKLGDIKSALVEVETDLISSN
ncbi:ATP-binding protein [Pelagicoccus sp. SDUM812005]|uniref:ATP-binding protein n=1 Tax=Pelagicoccus sp. SDUM812005 TaxID=3041257 RepID=UPI0028106A5A|nr:ATP-binding protein [Pelagicoccus sp. SDUM812005]MDQ8180904.1 ATP-binding protein [Pelagicoccus sp. SDUM812005]